MKHVWQDIDLQGKIKVMEDLNPRLFGIIAFISLIPVFAVSYVFFGENRAWGISLITGVCASVAYGRADIYKQRFFIISLSIIYIIEIFFLFLIRIPDDWPSYIMVPIGLGDSAIVYYLIAFIEKMVGSRSGNGEGQG
jgi:hypothetical protein